MTLSFATRILAACLSGAALAIISAPASLHWLHWFSLVPLLWALREGDHRKNAVLGYLSGFMSVHFCFYWLAETVVRFSNLPTLLAAFTLQLFCAVYALPYALVFGLAMPLRKRLGPLWVLIVPALQVANEYLTPVLFPYYQGAPQYRATWIWQLVSITGVYGLSYLVFLVNCVLAETLLRFQEKRRLPYILLVGTLSIFVANLLWGRARTERIDAELQGAMKLRVAMLQEAVTMEERMSTSAKQELMSWFGMTAKIMGQPVDLVIWPEGSSSYNPHEGNLKKLLGEMNANGNFDLIIGGGTREAVVDEASGGKRYRWFNSCYFIDRKGEVRGRYDKMVPLPFGEYIPLGDTFPFLRDLIDGPGNFRAGTNPTVFQADGYTFATPICYEAILPRAIRKLMEADLFVNITNDAWFGDTASPHQHAMLAIARAVEFGRPMVRATYTGINMIVEPNGRIVYETSPLVESADIVELRLGTFDTLYRQWGDWFPITCSLLSLLSMGLLFKRDRREPEPGAETPNTVLP